MGIGHGKGAGGGGQRGKLFSLAPLIFPLLSAPLPLPHSPLQFKTLEKITAGS